jgi:hypothetical protein
MSSILGTPPLYTLIAQAANTHTLLESAARRRVTYEDELTNQRGELQYLGYWRIRQGIQPQPKKVEAIPRLSAPQNRRQLRHFLGMVNYYRDVWQRRSHPLMPLTTLMAKEVP